jgi:ElaB/YqjD/DUF883 family membrane-anchored ribosome-binding protein
MTKEKAPAKKKMDYPSTRKSRILNPDTDIELNSKILIEASSLILKKLRKKAGIASGTVNEQKSIASSLTQLQVILHKEDLYRIEKEKAQLELEKLRKQLDILGDMSDEELKALVEQAKSYVEIVK